ncbi:hypothetical protein BROUX41_004788 [Berkeleyomyces rouxiae]|uniref:uncharacterized protein n=1 Tax=Berkeleyomyces rouxiae TaxID=2035830 RepID=UPI003B7E3926
MCAKVLTARGGPAEALKKLQTAMESKCDRPEPIPKPSNDLNALKRDGDSFTFNSFTTDDAFQLGTLLHARLLPYAREGRPTLISIALANSSQVLYQSVTGPGTAPDNECWARRKRNTVIRFGVSSWFMHNKFKGNQADFLDKYSIPDAIRGDYAIHGGGVPIKVKGVEGIVAVVVVSGLKQDEDHGVIVDVIKRNWE